MKEAHISDTTLDAARAREIAGMTGSVELEIDELDCSAAKELAKFRGEELFFMGDFPQMDECAAKELLKLGPNVLRIENLFAWSHAKAIEDKTLLALARYVHEILNLQGFPCLNQVSAQALTEFRGWQLLVYQKVLDLETARCLSLAEPDLLSVSVEQMDKEVARELSCSRARDDLQIVVNSGIDASVASELAQYQGGCLWITWQGNDQLDEETARALASVAGALRLEIEEIDQEVAKALASHTGVLDLGCLESLDATVARILAHATAEISELGQLSQRSKKIWKAAQAEKEQ